jgi:predicted alpha/beta hydrolase family esterase
MKSFARLDSSHPSPSLSLLATEPVRAFLDYLGSHFPHPPLAQGDGHPVIVYPGLGAGAWSTGRLRESLIGAGFDARDWGFGQNTGPKGSIPAWLAQMRNAVDAVRDETGREVSLVGWSLGGIYAREIGRDAPHLVRQVVTLGSPFAATPDTTHAGWLYRLLNHAKPESSYAKRMKQALPVPSTSIYSKSDGVVPWQGCLQASGRLAENIEVGGVSHLGMGTNRKVLKIVADRLGQAEGQWRRHAS